MFGMGHTIFSGSQKMGVCRYMPNPFITSLNRLFITIHNLTSTSGLGKILWLLAEMYPLIRYSEFLVKDFRLRHRKTKSLE